MADAGTIAFEERSRFAIGLRGAHLALLCLAATYVASFAVGGGLAQLLYPAMVLVAALWLRSNGPIGHIELVLWVYATAPLLRRMLDDQSGVYTELSPVMLAPGMAVLIGVPAAVMGIRRIRPRVALVLGVGAVAISYAFLVGFLRSGPNAAIAGAVEWLMPLLFGWIVAAADVDTEELLHRLATSLVWLALVAGAYGIFQYLTFPSWDEFWMRNTDMNSNGFPAPRQFRVWSTMNSPAPFAAVMGAVVIVLRRVQHKLVNVALALGYASLGMSLVRNAWIGWGIATISLLLLSHRPGRSSGRSLVLAALAVVVFASSGAASAVIDRFTETTSEGSNDDSLTARIQFHRDFLPVLAVEFDGNGLGATGTATRVGDSSTASPERIANVDSGLLETGYVLGGPLALLYLGVLTGAVMEQLRRARSMRPLEIAIVAAVIGLFVQLPLGNPLVGLSGLIFWALLGLLGRGPAAGADDAPVRAAAVASA